MVLNLGVVSAQQREMLIKSLLLLGIAGTMLVAHEPQDQPGSPTEPAKAAPAAPTRVRLSSGVAVGLQKKVTAPEYPPQARSRHIQGAVILNAIINTKGDVADLSFASGDALFKDAAMNAVKKWKYKPYLVDGNPVEVETTIQVRFTLTGR